MYQTIMFTHDDLDGAGCCILFQLFNDSKKRYEEWDVICSSITELSDRVYQEIDKGNVVPKYTTVYFADICPSVTVVQDLLNQGFTIRIYDHHQTNKWVCDLIEGAVVVPMTDVGIKECGTSLFYQHACDVAEVEPGHEYFTTKMNQKILPLFVETVRLYDTYEWKRYKKIEARQLQILFFMLGMDKFCARYLDKLKDPNDEDLINKTDMDFVLTRLESERRAIERFDPSKATDVNCRGRRVALVLGPQGANFSDLSSNFLEKYPEYDATVDFYLSSRGGTFQIRGKGDINLAEEIAQPIGGGGHPGACGAPLPQEYNDKLRSLIIEALTSYHV